MACLSGVAFATKPCKPQAEPALTVSSRHVATSHGVVRTPVQRLIGGGTTATHRRSLRMTAKNSSETELTPYEKKVLERRKQTMREYQGDPTAYRDRRAREADLYSDNWDGDKWKGSKFNALAVITVVSILAPVIGLLIAYFSYGTLWG